MDWESLWKFSLVGASSVSVGMGSLLLLKLIRRKPRCPCDDRMDGKTVIITGANSGIGKAAAQELALRGAKVIMACRNVDQGERAAADIRNHTQEGHLVVKKLDLASLQSIREFADDVISTEPKIEVVVNNAGVYGCPAWRTEDGFDKQMGVNHLGHFALTLLLVDKLRASAPSRVIGVSSSLAKYGVIDTENINAYSKKMYSNSKLAVNLFCRELSHRVKDFGIGIHCVHPGMACTGLARHTKIPWLLRPFAMFLYWLLARTPWEGAQPLVFCAVAGELTGVTGRYYGYCKEEAWNEISTDKEKQRKLWDVSEKLTGITL